METNNKKQRIMLMSGFLGSGKTTSMTALAEYINSTGKRACLITNDLGSNLVDTAYVNNHNIPVLEISNGCLCHDVDQLVTKINTHRENENPDIVIFEPVGSCVDMVDHVYRDVENRFHKDYVLAPVSAIVDPIRYRDVYIDKTEYKEAGAFSVAYGFKKQLEEADLLLLNKIDILSEAELKEIRESIECNFPGVPVIEISGLKGTNIKEWADYVLNNESDIRRLDIDMDIIYKGCEEMGWYNKVCTIESPEKVNIREICVDYLEQIKAAFKRENCEILHAKVNADAAEKYCKAAVTGTGRKIAVSGGLENFTGTGQINVNIRALMMPEPLAQLMEETLKSILTEHNIKIKDNALQSFLPVEDPPVPKEEY